MEDIDYKNTDEIVCPYCGYEFSDSWEFDMNHNSTKIKCAECNKEFECEAETTIKYASAKLNCTGEHNMYVDLVYIRDDEFNCETRKWDKLSVAQFGYVESYKCKNCEEQEWKDLTKDEFMKLYPKKFKIYADKYPELNDAKSEEVVKQ